VRFSATGNEALAMFANAPFLFRLSAAIPELRSVT